MFIAAFDSIGSLLWQTQIGSEAYDNLFDILHHPSEYIIATGLYSAPLIFDKDTVGLSNNYCDVFAASYDYDGRLQEVNVMGGKAEEFPQALAHDREGHVYIAGLFRDTTNVRHSVLTSAGTEEVFLAKLYHCNKNKVTFACDTVFVEGTELPLKVQGQYAAYDWEQGLSSKEKYVVTCSKVYHLRVEDSLHCVYRDSIAVYQVPATPKIQIRAELSWENVMLPVMHEWLSIHSTVPCVNFLFNAQKINFTDLGSLMNDHRHRKTIAYTKTANVTAKYCLG
jgi:hypothetical protein